MNGTGGAPAADLAPRWCDVFETACAAERSGR